MKHRSTTFATAAALCCWLLAAPTVARAQTREEFEELKQQLRALQEKTERLEKRLAEAESRPQPRAAKPTAPAPPSVVQQTQSAKETREVATTTLVTADEEGFVIKSADNRFRLRIHGIIQADGRFYLEDDGRDDANDTFLLRRVRPIVEGTIFSDFEFRITPEFGDGRSLVQDAYLEYTRSDAAKLRVGKFTAPVGLERLQSSSALIFVERGFPTNLVPNRDVGVQLSGAFADEAFEYQLGVFNGVPDGDSRDQNSNDAFDFVARLWMQPFKATNSAAVSGLRFGVAATYGDYTGSLPSYRTPGQRTFFSYDSDATADGTRWRVPPQGYYSRGPFSVLAEDARSNQQVQNATGLTTEVDAQAWQVVSTFVLTGEDAAYRGVRPKQNFGEGGLGSLELVARYGELHVGDEAFDFQLADPARSARSARGFGIGLNWNLNRNVRAMLDYDHTWFGEGGLFGDRGNEDVILTRLQLSF